MTMTPNNSMQLRCVTADDCDAVFSWRNHSETRKHSSDSAPLVLENHGNWFHSQLTCNDSLMLIGEVDRVPVGVVRYDFQGDQSEISVYVVPGEYRKGYGTELLHTSKRYLEEHFPNIKSVNAVVMSENEASHKFFLNAGYVFFETSNNSTTYTLSLA